MPVAVRALSCRALALALVATAAPSRAEEPTSARVWLDWSQGRRTEACLPPEEVVRDVEQLLGRRVFVPRSESDRTLHVDVTHYVEPSRYAAQMVLRSKSGRSLGTREIVIETSTCDDASEAFVLAISMLADLPRTAEEVASEAPPAPPQALPEPWRLQARLGPALALDGSGSVAPGAHVSAMLSPPGVWPFGLGALSTLRWSSPTPATRYVLSSTSFTATVCLPPHRDRERRLEVTGCAGPQATFHIGSGTGFAVDRTAVRTTLGGELQVYGGYALSPSIRLFAMLGLAATPQQVEIVFQDPAGNPRRVDLASHVTVSASIGLAFDIF
ncbi:MAG: hypothetical protein BGO98_19705 [Myxococcales bacterium 68-20]|nr:MAG: hypothetical protein BGO98_19705 [Myxococcales bacterium 68-20]